MAFSSRHYTLKLSLTAAALVVLTALWTYCWAIADISWAIPALVGTAWFIVLMILISLIRSPFHRVSAFLSAIKNRDLTTRFSDEEDPLFSSIDYPMNDILFKMLHEEKEYAERHMNSERIVKVMSHELRNSVTPIMSLTSHMLSKNNPEPMSESVREQIEVIHDQACYISEFLQTYQQLTSIPQPKREELSARSLFSHIRELMEAERGDVEIKYLIAGEMKINADAQLLTLVLINIIRNALYALQNSTDISHPLIEITATAPSKKTYISIKDNGPGIPFELQERIFHPYFSTRPGGTGIGLYLARQIILMHKGKISAISMPGNTIFSIELP